MKQIELLSPAKNQDIGKAAINNGADAVYIGAPMFGARKSAANSLRDIACLVNYAHRFYCRVYVTVNTVLYDHELAEAEKLIRQLYRIGVDALIIQDLGILRMDIPPIALHASTQMHNYDIDRIVFLDRIGFRRIVLARELSLEQLRTIRRHTNAELEVFVHGALCVSLSGRCYLSQYMFGRSANRGECAQPCRMKWYVKDSDGKVLVNNKYILSLKDLNLSAYIGDLIDAGIDSFKIEGRMKDENYVSNVTAYYSSLIDGQPDIRRTGSGKCFYGFEPSPEKSFNRGFSAYFFNGREKGLVNADSPKSVGKLLGRAVQSHGNRLQIETKEKIDNGDGLCYFEKGELKGIRVNKVEGNWVVCNGIADIRKDTLLYRNYDHRFATQVENSESVRKIAFRMEVDVRENRLIIRCTDEDQNVAEIISEETFEPAVGSARQEWLRNQLVKCGNTDYVCNECIFLSENILFVPVSTANALRRRVLELLSEVREQNREILMPFRENRGVRYPCHPDWRLNIVNRKAETFYADHGVRGIESGFENSGNRTGRELMHTRYCILYEIGRCRKSQRNDDVRFPLYLCNDRHRFLLEFDCKDCFMKIRNQ